VGSPGCAEFAWLLAEIDFDAVRTRWNLQPGQDIPGKKTRNFINCDFVKYAAGVKDPNPGNRQTQMAKWVAVAARCAYPWENAPSYDAEIPIEIEGAIVEARRNDPVGFLPISDWCALLVPPE